MVVISDLAHTVYPITNGDGGVPNQYLIRTPILMVRGTPTTVRLLGTDFVAIGTILLSHYSIGVDVILRSESILSLHAPTTSKCDFCQVSFCGISIPGRCLAAPLVAQQPHWFSDLGDLIQCGEVYECFDHNTVEVDIMLDYITAQGLSPRHIYREVGAPLRILSCDDSLHTRRLLPLFYGRPVSFRP